MAEQDSSDQNRAYVLMRKMRGHSEKNVEGYFREGKAKWMSADKLEWTFNHIYMKTQRQSPIFRDYCVRPRPGRVEWNVLLTIIPAK